MTYQKQWQFLKKMAELGKIPHALLFYGPDSEGKKALALDFIKLVNGEVQKKVNPDLLIVEPQGNKEIKISQIRELHSKLSLRAYSAPFKAVIIDKAHCLNQEAQSAFLKLLEEPKGQTIFILITEYPEKLLPTILSRVEKLRFYSPPSSWNEEKIKELLEISRADLAQRFQYAKKLSEDPQSLPEILENWLRYFREVLLSNLSQTKTIKILKTIQTLHYLISTTNLNPRLALEILMLEL